MGAIYFVFILNKILTLLGFQFWVLILHKSEKVFNISEERSFPVNAYSSKIQLCSLKPRYLRVATSLYNSMLCFQLAELSGSVD
jgi:hypothetical protein